MRGLTDLFLIAALGVIIAGAFEPAFAERAVQAIAEGGRWVATLFNQF